MTLVQLNGNLEGYLVVPVKNQWVKKISEEFRNSSML